MKIKKIIILGFFPFFFSCLQDDIIIDNGEGITIEFLEGLNDDSQFKLSKNSDGFYEMFIDRNKNQTIQRISGRLLRNGKPVWETLWSGPGPKKVNWESNLYWWLLDGDIIANVTYTYLNEFTGELVYVNLPPIINWKDELVPTINESSYSDSETGIVNTVIAPIREMVGDTMKIKLIYTHSITQKEEGSKFFSTFGERVFKDSVYVILK
jgi:hypothetical protein